MSKTKALSVSALYRKQLVILLGVFTAGSIGILLVAAKLLYPYYVDDLAHQTGQSLQHIETELVSTLLQQDYSTAHQIIDGPRFTAPTKTRELRLFALDEYSRTGLSNACQGVAESRPWGVICHEKGMIRIELPIKSADNTLAHVIVSTPPAIWTWKPFLLFAAAIAMLLAFAAVAEGVLLAVFKRRVAEPMEDKVRRLAEATDLDELNLLIKDVAIHEHRQLADMIVDRQVALQKATHELALMGEKERLFREASQLVHDVKTPIAGVAAQADRLDISADEKSTLRTGLGRIRELLEGYLAKVRPHTAEPHAAPASAEVGDVDQPCLGILVNTLRQSYGQYASERGVSLSLDLPRKAWVTALACNENKLERALTNLLSNAIDAAADSAQRSVRIQVSIAGCSAEISMIDSGPGFPAELLASLMRGAGQTTKPRGTGMGFIGAKETITAYGGSLRVTRSGAFTAVVATIPVVTGESWLYDPGKENPGRVLSIDDDSTFHFVLEHRMPDTRFEKMTAFPVGRELPSAEYDRIFVDYDLGSERTGLEYIIESGLKSDACLVSGMIALDRDLYRSVREKCVRAIPKEYFITDY